MFQFHELDLNWWPSHTNISGKNSRNCVNIFDQFKPDSSISDEEFGNCIVCNWSGIFCAEYYWEAH